MKAKTGLLALHLAVTAVLLIAPAGRTAAQVTTQSGSFADGATYLIEVPAAWNGTLLLYSHGYVVPGSANPARDVGDPLTRAFLLAQGFALAGSSYAGTGWAIEDALRAQIAVLDTFASTVGKPARTIAWGHSLGGIITAGLVQRHPERFDGALPMCGVLAGGVGTWNQALDAAWAFQTLLGAGTGLQVVHITNPFPNLGLAEALLAGAQASPQGRARIALVGALGDTPGWFDPTTPEPADNDFAAREANQFLWASQVTFPFVFAFRAELEARAGGNPSWNTGVDYRRQLRKSTGHDEVVALYAEAGLDLDSDLATLNHAARIPAEWKAVDYLERNIVFEGDISIPVLTMHTDGDGLVTPQNETAYASAVREAGRGELLRQTFVHRAGHCTFTPAETISALQALLHRLDTGRWGGLSPDQLNAAALGLGTTFNVISGGGGLLHTPPTFFRHRAGPFLRPFDLVGERGDRGGREGEDGERARAE
jgi:pimeloyl-ACP methyl ester carboxylesterase